MSVLFYDGVDHMIKKITTLFKGKADSSHKHTKSDITDFPTLGTASSKDVASSGNASATQVVMGNDTRLSDARKASDVSAWAKASTKPTYTASEVGAYTKTETDTKLNGKANSSHTHGNGDITSLDAGKITSGTISIDRLPQGALDRLIKVVDDTARFKLTTKDVQLGDSVKVTSTKKMYIVVDETKLSSEDGYEPYTADSATSVPWSGVTGKPSTYTPSSHTHTKSQITDFPSSLPANGGNASTVNGHTVESNVPSGAKFTDTTYTSKSAVSGGTDVSLVTTGEKATWNAKTSNAGTITGIKMNGASKGTSGVVDLGTVLTGGSQTSTSDEDGGENVYTFSDGSTITIKNGTKGDAGTGGSNRLTYYETRPTSANKASSSDRVGSIEAFVASSSMTTGKPSADAKILQMNWDNTTGWDSQLAMINSGTLQHRNMSSGKWQDWKTVLDSSNYSKQMRLEEAFSWTPIFNRGDTNIGTNVAVGYYYKIGKLVYIRGYVELQESSPCYSIKGIPLAVKASVTIPLNNLLSVHISKLNSNVLNVGEAALTEIKNKGYNTSDKGIYWIIEGWYLTD